MFAFLLACTQDPCTARWWDRDQVVSPTDGAVFGSTPWIPLTVSEPAGWEEATVTAVIDGALQPEIPGIVRSRSEGRGAQTEYIGHLDLDALGPGDHEAGALFELPNGSTWCATARFEIERPPHRLDLRVTDASGAAVDARVLLLQDGERVQLAGSDDPGVYLRDLDSQLSSVLVLGGDGGVFLDPGTYELVAWRNGLAGVAQAEVELDGDREVALTLGAGVDLGDTALADFHVHTARSWDASLPDTVRARTLAAAGLDFVVASDHEVVVDYEPVLESVLGEHRTVRAATGLEAHLRDLDDEGHSYGHVNHFPHRTDTSWPAGVEDGDLATSLEAWHELPLPEGVEASVLQLNHPRGLQVPGEPEIRRHQDLFGELGLDPTGAPGSGANAWMDDTTPSGTTPLAFDAIEVLNRGSATLYEEVRQDWFFLLDHGYPLTATGNSDSHAMALETVGFPVTLAPCAGTSDPEACWVSAVREGRVSVSSGPLVELEIRAGDQTASPGDRIAAGEDAVAMVRVQAADWVPVPQLRLVIDGEVVESLDLSGLPRDEDGVLRVEQSWRLDPVDEPGWVLAEAGWPLGVLPSTDQLGVYADVAVGHTPLGFTNPVFLEPE